MKTKFVPTSTLEWHRGGINVNYSVVHNHYQNRFHAGQMWQLEAVKVIRIGFEPALFDVLDVVHDDFVCRGIVFLGIHFSWGHGTASWPMYQQPEGVHHV